MGVAVWVELACSDGLIREFVVEKRVDRVCVCVCVGKVRKEGEVRWW